jgi:hypothetical protein
LKRAGSIGIRDATRETAAPDDAEEDGEPIDDCAPGPRISNFLKVTTIIL